MKFTSHQIKKKDPIQQSTKKRKEFILEGKRKEKKRKEKKRKEKKGKEGKKDTERSLNSLSSIFLSPPTGPRTNFATVSKYGSKTFL